MRAGKLVTTICGVPCVVHYWYADALPATLLDPAEPAEIELDRVTDDLGNRIDWMEGELIGTKWERICESINDQEIP